LISLQKNNNLNLNYQNKNNKRLCSVWFKGRTINVGVQSLEDTASESDASSRVVAISVDHLYWTTRILLQALPLISLQTNDNLNLNYKNKKTEDHIQYGYKELSTLVNNPCIMECLLFFGVIMLCLTIMKRKP
jgi:hypothetical protein